MIHTLTDPNFWRWFAAEIFTDWTTYAAAAAIAGSILWYHIGKQSDQE